MDGPHNHLSAMNLQDEIVNKVRFRAKNDTKEKNAIQIAILPFKKVYSKNILKKINVYGQISLYLVKMMQL